MSAGPFPIVAASTASMPLTCQSNPQQASINSTMIFLLVSLHCSTLIIIHIRPHKTGIFQGLWMTSVDGCADSTLDGKAYAAMLAGSPAGMLELPRATFNPSFGIAGGLLPDAACCQADVLRTFHIFWSNSRQQGRRVQWPTVHSLMALQDMHTVPLLLLCDAKK